MSVSRGCFILFSEIDRVLTSEVEKIETPPPDQAAVLQKVEKKHKTEEVLDES